MAQTAVDEGCPVPKKRMRSSCMIHCTTDRSALVSPKNFSSWQTLLNAATIRQHVGILELAKGVKDDEIPPVLYHRKCHSYFTMKRSLNSIQSQQSGNEIEVSLDDSRRSVHGKPSASRVYSSEECIICGRKTKYKSGSGTRENLV